MENEKQLEELLAFKKSHPWLFNSNSAKVGLAVFGFNMLGYIITASIFFAAVGIFVILAGFANSLFG